MNLVLRLTFLFPLANGHTAAWAPGMYCLGTAQNWNMPVHPLYKLFKIDWWFQHDRGCDGHPPSPGDILELPAGGTFTVELAHNKLQTTLGRCPSDLTCTSSWPDGKEHPEDWSYPDGEDFSWPPGMGKNGESVGFDGGEHPMGCPGKAGGSVTPGGTGTGTGMGQRCQGQVTRGMGLISEASDESSCLSECLSDFQLHTKNESMAAGTAWAISYHSDILTITMENLIVFTTLAK